MFVPLYSTLNEICLSSICNPLFPVFFQYACSSPDSALSSSPPPAMRLFSLKNNFAKLAPTLGYFLYHGYTLSEAWREVNWADLMAAQVAFGTDFYDRSSQNDSRHDALDGV